ncbi:plasmid segregation centromere-binding protein ParR [Anabaena sphaerica FACHB-251]|uniref:Plasmid segregation centromere-binding protein ParR n=1 Tax=Anabaena sphaerica FACHB-251 TaxID=2692883 RepID=A0A926WJB3_9NOST|nr:plasmid segregation centromere-binding protein ParR [Anabaena sphaerica]MBD2295210.1 plasmid segregation centromere-binding protein ParR [Anabaena sphaerica FACHB-251]
MFQWSKKVVKSVTFNPEIGDESLLAQVESFLEAQPEKTFSDLCKEALWQALCVPDSVPPSPNTAALPMEQQIGELQRQIAGLEERFFAKESNRLQAMESQILQLSQQMAQLAIMVNQAGSIQPASSSVPTAEVVNNPAFITDTTPQEVDPVISRLSSLVDDF